VLQVLPGTVAEAAGIRRFDVLLKLNGESLDGHKFGGKRLEAMLKNRKTAVLTIRRSPNLLHKLGHKSFLTKDIQKHVTSEAEVAQLTLPRTKDHPGALERRTRAVNEGIRMLRGTHKARLCARGAACGRYGWHRR
jgi:C-terminal processing protease CtpA/Prc